jgi:hypothetical protein
MNLQMIPDRKRPVLVWVIVAYIAIFKSWGLLFAVRGFFGYPLDNAGAHEYLANLSRLDYLLSLAILAAEFSAAIALFFLRKAAVYLFAAAAVLSAVGTWHFMTPQWLASMGGSRFYWVSAGIGVALIAAMCAYSWRLLQRGLLV